MFIKLSKKPGSIFLVYMLLFSFCFSFILTGCKEKKEGVQADQEPKEIVIGLESSPEINILKNSGHIWFPNQIYETLVVPDDNMKPKPLLAESWQRIDAVTWKFKIKKGVKFHDGAPFNAEAVKDSLERLQKEGPIWNNLLIETIKVEDDYTLLIKNEKSFSPFIEALMAPCVAMISPGKKEDCVVEYPYGTGPFKLEEFITDQKVVVVRNDDYWGKKPVLQRVVYKIIKDPNTRILALQKGEVDAIRDIPLSEISILEADKKIKVIRTSGTRTTYYGFNMDKEYFKDIRVRKAFNYAIDKEAIVKHVLNSVGQPAKGFVTPSIPGYLDLEGYPYHPEKAKLLLAEAGWKDTNGDGILDKNRKPFKITLVINPFAAYLKDVGELIQAQLREVGVEVNIKIVEQGAINDIVMNRDFDLVSDASPARSGGADYQLMSRFHSTVNPVIHARTGYVNKKVDYLLDEARKEADESKCIQMYQEVQKILEQDAAVIPLFYEMEVIAVRSNVKNLTPHSAIWPIDLTDVDIVKD